MAKARAIQDAVVEAIETAQAGVVRVAAGCGNAASGIVLDDQGHVLTSAKALGGEGALVAIGDDRREARLVGRDTDTDVALLQVEGAPLGRPLAFRDHAELRLGQFCIALGRPGTALRASLRIIGVLAGATRLPRGGRIDAYVETDRAIPQGFGGGPLCDLDGRAIGMSTRAAWRGADLAVPHATIARVTAALREHGGVVRGYLGVGVQSVRVPKSFGHAQDRGALVVAVQDGGPAARAGLIVGDLLLALAGAPVRGPLELRDALFERAGQPVELSILRGGEPRTLTAEPTRRSES